MHAPATPEKRLVQDSQGIWRLTDSESAPEPVPDTADRESPWRYRAACLDAPLELFFPSRNINNPETYDAALKICSTCPVKKQCLDFALEVETSDSDRNGVFGGLRPQERKDLARYRRSVRPQ
ncbi:WhiB family transcriptional regulator [Nesterenkonia rhizosphaerae]